MEANAMRVEHNGIALWYGTADAPAPTDQVSVGTPVMVTVGVYPIDASNSVEIIYRINQGSVNHLAAQYLKSGRNKTAHYFRATLPTLNLGDKVEYMAFCHCAGRQVPPASAITEFTTSFTVVETGDEQEAQSPLQPETPTSSPELTPASGLPPYPTDAPAPASGLPPYPTDIPAPAPQPPAPTDIPAPAPAPQPPAPTDIPAPAPAPPLSRLPSQKRKHLKHLTMGIAGKKHKEKIEQLFAEAEGEFNSFKSRLEESEDFDDASIQRLTLNHEVAELLEDQDNWVTAFTQNNSVHNLRDIALNYRKQDFKSLIRAAGIPKDAEGEDEEDCLENCATRVSDRLFRMAPTAVIHRMVRDQEVAAEDQNVRHGVDSFLNQNPELDFRKTSVLQALQRPESLQDVPEAHRENVVDGLKKLQRLSVLSPKAETVPTLMKAELTSAYAINEVPMERFVSLYADRLGGEKVARTVHRNAQNVTVRNEEAYIALRQAITGAPVRMIHGDLATDTRKDEAAAFVQQNKIPLNFGTLFGNVDLCECGHCNSVYSPAAYLVELFQYLRNNNLDPDNDKTGEDGINGTPLKKFFRRRPDLGHLQLTCENTNTLIPYIDLVNEVMESFIAHLDDYEADNHSPKQTNIAVHNVKDESSGELLAEPQHTNYKTYRILKKAVYPVCKLPYHQPIDATRQYLNYLGTSRYELFETFRKDVSFPVEENASEAVIARAAQMKALKVQAVDRAITAEFLHLTEEEYVILTKEGFHTKEWYELKEETYFTRLQYNKKIGLKKPWHYYGIKTESQMLSELKWVKPAQETGIVGFLRRVNMQYVDLIELLKTRYINPNYLSGKALAYMNSIRYSYRYLQSLVEEGETDLKAKYKRVVELLQKSLLRQPFRLRRFDVDYVECWVYKYFEKIGRLIVLEDASSCDCVEGTIRLFGRKTRESDISSISLCLNKGCQIYILDTAPKQYIGQLNTATGKIAFDQGFTKDFDITSGDFRGLNGETGKVLQDYVLEVDYEPFICTDYKEKCDISTTQFRHLDGTDLAVKKYDRMHRFIRLWCKLGWSIAEIDQAISGVGETIEPTLTKTPKPLIAVPTTHPGDKSLTLSGSQSSAQPLDRKRLVALMPSDEPPGEEDNNDDDTYDDTFTANRPCLNPEEDCQPEPISQIKQDITPYLITQLVAIKKLLEITGLELAKLLTYWTDIGVYGEDALYERLFLKYNLIAVDKVFAEDEYGTYLSQENSICDHLPVLMSALKVDVNMLETILSLVLNSEVSASDDDVCQDYPLTLENVSILYRHTLLAKTLGLRIKEIPGVLALMQALAHPFNEPTETLEFYELFARIDASDFSPQVLNYTLRDKDDPLRPLRPSMADIFRLAILLRDALLQIEIDHPDIEKDEEATEELLRSKLSLLYDGAIVEKIIALLQGTSIYEDNTRRKYSAQLTEVDQTAITAFLQAERKKEEEQPGGDYQTFLQRVQFSGTKGLQTTGILSASDQEKITALADLIADPDTKEKFLIVIAKLYEQPERFFEDALLPLFTQDANAATAAKDLLLAEDKADTENLNQDSSFQKRAFFSRAFMPYLREELRQRQVVQMLAADLGLDQDITQHLVMEVIKTPSGESLYQEIIRLREQKDPEAEAQHWQGFFVPEKEGKYTFLLEAEGDAILTFQNRSLWTQPLRTDDEKINFYQSQNRFLKAGRAYPFRLEGHDEDDADNILGLFMKFNDQAQVEISNKILFPELRTETFRGAYIQLQKAAIAINGFSMKLEEISFFLDFPARFENLDFNAITFSHWLRLEAFYRLHKSLSKTQLGLVDFLRWANQIEAAETAPSLIEQLNALTGWESSAIYKMILPKHFSLSHPEHFQDERNLLKLQQTLHVARKIGVGMGDLFKWGQPTSHFKENRKRAGSIRETLRARYNQAEWEEAIKSTQDQLRENQKQALIAYLLAQPTLMEWGVRDANGLFEFFLIDVQMDACMETSRIKQAISSVQLFVQRCFLGLEKSYGVFPKELDQQRWEWMSRYRVWEANRKVFLYPENWIRPELRDVKSPFFQELESELLQNDISTETVKNALTKYIVQVNEVSNLEVVGQYLEGDKKTGKLHVIGRTRNAPYFYYYRYYNYENENWYPWKKIPVDIPGFDIENKNGEIIHNGSFVLPVVWKNRLFIFFPQFMRKSWSSTLAKEKNISEGAENKVKETEPIGYWEIKMGWSEYKEHQWTPKNISAEALYSFEYKEGVLGSNLSANNVFTFMQNPSKFIFTIYKLSNSVKIQVYYRNPEISIWEYLTSGGKYNALKDELTSDSTSLFSQTFRFNGDSITLGILASLEIPEQLDSKTPIFHYFRESGKDIRYPLQAQKIAESPTSMIIPNFTRNRDFSSVKLTSANAYTFSYSRPKVLLGHLRRDRLKRIFRGGVPLNNNNYGSNNSIQYHELKRPYSIYNWEALFHSVSLLADSLSKSQRFEEAMQWWHYVFNPIDVKDDIKKVWQFLPFRKTNSKNILEEIFNSLNPNTDNESITEWRDNPFMPHVIARARPTAYMKWVVMKYIDNLIAWGDHLFRQDTIETLNQATQLYVLAGHILGPRPEIIPKRGNIQPKSYMALVDEWDAFSNTMVDLELIFPFSNQLESSGVSDGESHYVNIYGFATTLYFCIPDNPKLLEYWDTVADRLFKIRHCLNIEGVFRKLNLFEPPIDPALLVQAAAQGLSIGSVLNDLSTPMPNYRFNYLLQRALEVTSEVKSLGSALLSALEKKDGESLSLLRAQHDTRLQNLVMEVRKKQREEAEKSLKILEENRKSPEYRLQHYLQLAGEEASELPIDTEFMEVENQIPEVKEESGMKLIPPEAEEVKKAKQSRDLQIGVGAVETLASTLHALPTVEVKGQPLGIGVGLAWGGTNLGNITQAVAKGLQIGVGVTSAQSSAASRKAGYTRQLQDRIFQANLAGHELMQIDKQVTAQKIRKEIAQLEIDNHQIQIEQTQDVEEFIRNKYSNEQLYQWMSDQLKDLYDQAYSFAYDLAKKAEKVFRFEMGLSTSDFIKFGYWDSARDGFLAGEQLYLDLKHLENTYVENKPHDYEITKHISLQQLNPLALIQLKEQGLCEFSLPEETFDLDYPGHYKRRIKTISVSIPCIVGPYTSLNCTLRLLKHEYRNSKIAASASDYAKKLEEADERFIFNPIPTTAIAVSQGQNDSGVFELNFRDERYLPFEGAGAISTWRLELPQEFRQFDYQTISDVILHLRYTSCEGGATLKTAALDHLMAYVEDASELSKREGLFRMLSLRHEFPTEWHRFLTPEPEAASQLIVLGSLKDRLPFFANNQKVTSLKIQSVMLFTPMEGLTASLLRSDQAEDLNVDMEPVVELGLGASIDQLQQYEASDIDEELNGYWALQISEPIPLTAEMIKDAWLVMKYQIELQT
ncbi:MAG: neuraminidase-like domain-containing protein [Cyanobacteria bacterium J06634_5]